MTTYCPTKQEVLFYEVDYEMMSIKKVVREYYSLKESCLYQPNFELIAILSDLENAINNCGLTEKQRKSLMLYMEGYTEAEIGEMFDTSQQNINKTLNKGCNKISAYLSYEVTK